MAAHREPITRRTAPPFEERASVRVFAQLGAGRADGTYERRLASFARPHLLILDDFGLKPLRESYRGRATRKRVTEKRGGTEANADV